MNEHGLKIGDVLWRMHGRKKEEDGETAWFAIPCCVEYIDEHKFLDGCGCGGSLNSIGKNWFPTREECLKHWEEHRKEYEQPAFTTTALHQRPRLGSIVKDDTWFWKDEDILRVYRNGTPIPQDALPWKMDDMPGEYGQTVFRTSLGMIRDALPGRAILTVWYEEPTHGAIYQTGNYPPETAWRLHGQTMGFA